MLLRFLVGLSLSHHLLCAGFLEVCHDEIREEFRCFDIWPPYTNTNFHLPASPSSQNIHFKLFTVHNPHTPQFLGANDAQSFRDSNWDVRSDTKVVVHGFISSSDTDWMADMVAQLLVRRVNVIVVDWANGAKGPNYIQAAANTRVVGAQIASLILTAESLGYSASRFHIIGHSLGAHIGGYAGQYLKSRLGRITGLDAAAPLFENYENPVKLDKNDALFVDVIHTDAEPLHEAGFGTVELIGHVDFFPNGGSNMPGCSESKLNWIMLLTGQISEFGDDVSCSHGMAPLYFTASINDNSFVAYPCHSADGGCNVCGTAGCTNMGYDATSGYSGLYVLTTGARYPY